MPFVYIKIKTFPQLLLILQKNIKNGFWIRTHAAARINAQGNQRGLV
jgi:hypothetical protein